MNGPFIIHSRCLSSPMTQLGFTNLFSWYIWGWNHDAAADYAGVQFVKREWGCLENDLHIDNALCVEEATLLLQFDESTTLIDWLVLLGATHCETMFFRTVAQKSTGEHVKLSSFHSEKGPEFNVRKSSSVPNKWTKWMCAMRLTTGDWTHKHHRRGLFRRNAIAKTFKGELLNWESQSSSNIVRVGVWIVNQWWIRMIFRHEFSVPKVCSPDPSKSCRRHSEVSMIFFGLWSPKRFVVAFFDVGPMFPCNKNHEAMKNCRDWAFSLQGLEILLPAFQLPMFAKCDALPKGDLFNMSGHVCLRNPCLLSKSKDPIPTRSPRGPWERQHALSALNDGEKSCLQKIVSRYPRFGLQDIDSDLGCLVYETAASQ